LWAKVKDILPVGKLRVWPHIAKTVVCLSRVKAKAVAKVEYSVPKHLNIAVETEVHLFILECCTVYNPVTFVMVVLVEAVIQVVCSNIIQEDMCSVRATALLVSTLLETVTIYANGAIFKITVVDSPAILDESRVSSIVQVPTIIRVVPASVAMPLIARARIQFVGKAIGISAMRLYIVVEV
jgi:hypothetical protein